MSDWAPPPPPYEAPVQQQGNGLAVAGMVCAIVGILVFWIILGPLGIIFGAIGLQRANRGAPRRNMALAGIIIGIADILLYVILIVVTGFVI